MMPPSRPRSPLWIVVLGLACEEPMHPYRMQTLIKQRGKDQIANVAQRNSVYQTIDALQRAGLIASHGTSREERRPERTVYEATEEGRQALRSWVRRGISTPAREFPEFPAALSTLYGVDGPDDLRTLLEARVEALEARQADLEKPYPGLPRIFLLEAEHMAHVARAEVKWLRGIIADIRSGRLTYPTEQEIRRISSSMGAPSADAAARIAREMRGPSESRGSGSRAVKSETVATGDKRRRVKRVKAPRRRTR